MGWELPTGTHATGDCDPKTCEFCICNEKTLPLHTYTNNCDTTCNYIMTDGKPCEHKRVAPHDYVKGVCSGCGQADPDYKPEAEEIVGDYDGDKLVTDSDVIYLLWHTVFAEDYPLNGKKADFDGDGAVTDSDVIYLLWHTVFPEDYPLNK